MGCWSALMAEKSRAEPLDPGPGFDERLRALVRSATEPEPEDRTRTMREVAVGLRALLGPEQERELAARLGRSTSAGPPVRVALPEARSGNRWLVAGVLAGFLVVGGGFVAVALVLAAAWWVLA